MENDELQTVFTTTHPAEAEIARLALENEGMAAFVEGAKQAAFTGALAVRVNVAQKDAARAEALIAQLEHTNIPEEKWEESFGEEALDEDAR